MMPRSLRRFTSPKLLLGLSPSSGDLIEIDRVIYSDWALYYGNDDVVIVSCEDGKISEQTAEVTLLSLEDFANDSPVRVNNKEVPARTRGLSPLPINDILENASRLIGQKVRYNYLTKNSEHYVTEWRFGHGWSDQVSLAASILHHFNELLIYNILLRLTKSELYDVNTHLTTHTSAYQFCAIFSLNREILC